MKFMYPAVFRKNEDGTYNGYFPDLECCTSTGDTLDEAIENANEAAYNWITVELDEEEPNLPSISDPSDLDLTPEEVPPHYYNLPGFFLQTAHKVPGSRRLLLCPSALSC